MLRSLAAIILLLCFPLFPAEAGEVREIELTDGSILSGEVLSLSNGVYTIRSEAMGTVTVKDSSVRAIRRKSAVSSPPQDHAREIQSLQKQMMSDQEVMSLIEGLKNDPSFQSVLQDPEIVKAVSAGDIGALMANPRFLELMNNSTVKNIQQKMVK